MGINGELVLGFALVIASAVISPGCHANVPGEFKCRGGEKPT